MLRMMGFYSAGALRCIFGAMSVASLVDVAVSMVRLLDMDEWWRPQRGWQSSLEWYAMTICLDIHHVIGKSIKIWRSMVKV